ncbi:unnamed protein product, partial [Amoebophrya sp. A120]
HPTPRPVFGFTTRITLKDRQVSQYHPTEVCGFVSSVRPMSSGRAWAVLRTMSPGWMYAAALRVRGFWPELLPQFDNPVQKYRT